MADVHNRGEVNSGSERQCLERTYLGSSSSGTKGIGARASKGMCLLPLNSHTKPPFSTTSYADTTGSFGQSPCIAQTSG